MEIWNILKILRKMQTLSNHNTKDAVFKIHRMIVKYDKTIDSLLFKTQNRKILVW